MRHRIAVPLLCAVVLAGVLLGLAAFGAGPRTAPAANAADPPATPAPPASTATPSAPTPDGPAATAGKKNVVLVLVDDMSSDLLKYMPNVQRLAKDGTTFSKYIVSDSLCCPSRSTLFTGDLPHNTGVFTNMAPDGGFDTFRENGNEARSYNVALQQAGYRTAMLGKYMNGYKTATSGVPQGWDEWAVADGGYRNFNYTLNENGTEKRYGNAPEDYLVDVIAGKGRAFIDRSVDEGKPFALELSTFTPHGPSVPAPRDRGKFAGETQPRVSSFDRANVDAPSWLRKATKLTDPEIAKIDKTFAKRARSLIAVDDMLGALRKQLTARGVAENTVVMFTSDNGFHLGQHRLLSGKQTAFDHDIRVPLIVSGPGVRKGATSDALVQNTDLAPTFETFAGRIPDAGRDGRSILPLLSTGRTPKDWRDAALIEHHGPDLQPGDPDKQPARAGNPTTYTALRLKDATYVEYRNGEREYYDNRRDPDQRRNVYRDLGPKTRKRLHDQVRGLERCDGAKACSTD